MEYTAKAITSRAQEQLIQLWLEQIEEAINDGRTSVRFIHDGSHYYDTAIKTLKEKGFNVDYQPRRKYFLGSFLCNHINVWW